MRLLKADSYPAMPWKNGGGETREVALSPAGASLNNFDWRVSIARVDGDGPFSAFAGINRTLTILSGAMTLIDSEDRGVHLDSGSPPFPFDGGQAITAVVTQAPVFDLNVMTRRTSHCHVVRRMSFRDEAVVTGATGVTILVALQDGAVCGDVPIVRHDCLIVARDETVTLTASGTVAMLRIEIDPA